MIIAIQFFIQQSCIERGAIIADVDTPKIVRSISVTDSSTSAGKAKTPKGSRINPFESHLSMDTLHLPTFSPSVFSTVLSPSQESVSLRCPQIVENNDNQNLNFLMISSYTQFTSSFDTLNFLYSLVDFGQLTNKRCFSLQKYQKILLGSRKRRTQKWMQIPKIVPRKQLNCTLANTIKSQVRTTRQ